MTSRVEIHCFHSLFLFDPSSKRVCARARVCVCVCVCFMSNVFVLNVSDFLLPLNVQHVVQVRDIADCQAQDFDLGELLIGRKGWQKFPQLGEGHVKCLHPYPLSCGMSGSVLRGGTSPPSLLLTRQGLVRPGLATRLVTHTFDFDHIYDGLWIGLSPRKVRVGLIRAQHHFQCGCVAKIE